MVLLDTKTMAIEPLNASLQNWKKRDYDDDEEEFNILLNSSPKKKNNQNTVKKDRQWNDIELMEESNAMNGYDDLLGDDDI